MGYFRELPDLAYQNFLSDSLSSQSYIEVKKGLIKRLTSACFDSFN